MNSFVDYSIVCKALIHTGIYDKCPASSGLTFCDVEEVAISVFVSGIMVVLLG